MNILNTPVITTTNSSSVTGHYVIPTNFVCESNGAPPPAAGVSFVEQSWSYVAANSYSQHEFLNTSQNDKSWLNNSITEKNFLNSSLNLPPEQR